MPKPNVNCKSILEIWMNSSPLDVVLSVWMKTQPIMIGPTTKSAISDYGMESSCADSIPESMSANSKSKSLESTPTDSGVEFYVGYSKLELFFANSKLEFVVKLKIPTTSLKKCLSMELKLFG